MTIGRSMSVLLQTAQFILPAAKSMYVCLQLAVALTLAADWLFPSFWNRSCAVYIVSVGCLFEDYHICIIFVCILTSASHDSVKGLRPLFDLFRRRPVMIRKHTILAYLRPRKRSFLTDKRGNALVDNQQCGRGREGIQKI